MNGLLIAIFWLHFLGDFVFQTDKMAQGKSKSNWILTAHISVYAFPFLVLGWRYALANAIVHWGVDWVTSRMTSRLWAKKKQHMFFVVIGADQAIHMTTLVLTMGLCR